MNLEREATEQSAPNRPAATRGSRIADWIARHPGLSLLIGSVLFLVASVALSGLRVIELRPTAYDMGLYQQALWSGAHGGSFYEAPDWQTAGYGTFFQVHLSAILFLVAPVYAALPRSFTLVVLQSAVTAGAALPLYLLAKDRLHSVTHALAVAALFLGWAPLLAATTFDFHVESFVPLAVLSFMVLWRRRNYIAAMLPFAATVAIGEFSAALLVLLSIYLIWDGTRGPAEPTRVHGRTRLLGWLRRSDTLPNLALLGASVSLTIFLVIAQSQILSPLAAGGATGGGPLPPGLSLAGWASSFHLSLANAPTNDWAKLTDWVILLGLTGFVPLLTRRWLVIGLPWIAFSVLSLTGVYAQPGNQYAFISAVPIFIGVVDGWPRFRSLLAALAAPAGSLDRPRAARRRFAMGNPWILAVIGLVALNLLASPIDPVLQSDPGLGPGYAITYAVPPGYQDALAVASSIPAGVSVLSSTNLFPLVANDPNAFVLAGAVAPEGYVHLPFGGASLPPAVLLSSTQLADVPTWLSDSLYNTSSYRLCALAWQTPAGAVLLFETPWLASRQCSTPRFFGPSPAAHQDYPAGALVPGSAGIFETPASSGGPSAIVSEPGVGGNVWHGPYAILEPGAYSAHLEVEGFAWPLAPVPLNQTPLLQLTIGAFGQAPWVRSLLTFAELANSSSGSIAFPFTVTAPSVGVEVVGDQVSLQGYVVLDDIRLDRVA